MEGVEATGTAADQNTPRQVVSIRGQNVDITGLGIDIDFLNALPADMREEVLTQHIRDRRAAAQENSQQQAVELTPEFLEALPAEIRAELIQQEAADRRRRERLARQAQAQQASGRPAGPAEIDPASFLASLDPLLRQQVLMDMDQDDDLFSSLPPHLLAELAQVRAMPRDMERIRASRGSPSQVTAAVSGDAQKVKADEASAPKPKREAIQLLDKNGVVGLLRLVFLPLPQQKNVLHDVLLSLCENRQSRAEIISHLLLILQDGTADVHGAERCFNMMTKKARSTFTETPMKTPKRSAGPMQLPLMIGDNAPSLVALQTLQALSHLVHYNAQLATFFLTEHDTLAARRNAKAKGKGKESTSRASRFPINNLVSLLDRDVILSNSENLEQLSHLLSIVTRPLLMLKKRQKLERQESENVEMTTIESNPDQQESTIITTETTAGKSEAADRENKAKSRKALVPPEVPDDNLRLVVNILRANECSSKTFQNTLATMQHIGALPGAKQAVADELVKQAQALSQSIQSQLLGLLEHIRSLKADEEIQSSIFAPFSSGSSSQAKLLRILKSIDYLFEARRTELEEGTHAQQEQIGIVAKLEDSLNFGPLWSELSECLTIIHERSNMIHVATILLPLIEALMVVCKQITTSKEARISGSRQATPASGESLSSQFFNFTEQHRKILNQMVRNNPALMSGSFSLLVKNPKVLEFDNKRNYFVRKLRDKAAKEHYRPLALNVRREMIFLDSYKNLHFKSGDEIKYAKLNIRFAGEEGVDAGGVTREWFQVLARQMFDPNYALFVPVNADRNTYHPNKLSGVNPEHLSFFKFVGRIVGKALYDGRLLDCHFSRPVYRKMLGKNVSLKDMETLDLEYYKSLLWMLENDITDIITETFSVERDDFGEVTIVDLVPNGREIAVTEENKQEYVARVTQYRLLDSVSEQLEHFMKGFNDIIPPELVSIFNEQEIELLISGLPDIDADDWRNNTEYHNYTAASPQIQWFWRAVRSFDDEERARLLQFATGSSRIPVEGFANLEGMHGVQKFNIHRDYTHGDRLPQSHTCFNQLDLPEYDSYETLRNALLTAISEGNEGFGFA
jgi:E3 ubiquitin-protein ligase HUWE1